MVLNKKSVSDPENLVCAFRGKCNKNEHEKPNKNNSHNLPKTDEKILISACKNINKLQVE